MTPSIGGTRFTRENRWRVAVASVTCRPCVINFIITICLRKRVWISSRPYNSPITIRTTEQERSLQQISNAVQLVKKRAFCLSWKQKHFGQLSSVPDLRNLKRTVQPALEISQSSARARTTIAASLCTYPPSLCTTLNMISQKWRQK